MGNRRRRGQALVEFAIALPILILLVAGVLGAEFEKAIKAAAIESPAAKVAQSLVSEFRKRVEAEFSQAVSIFEKELKTFVEKNGKDEDAALKNGDFARQVFKWRSNK